MSNGSKLLINEIRNNKSDFQPFKRSLNISALTVSLLMHEDFDKLNILLDYLNDFEDGIWQRALSSVYIVSIANPEIVKYLMKTRYKVLQHNQFQKGLLNLRKTEIKFSCIIDSKSNKPVNLNEYADFFDVPQNWFLPFYRNNPILLSKMTEKELINYWNDLTILSQDTFKYITLLNIKEYSILANKKYKVEFHNPDAPFNTIAFDGSDNRHSKSQIYYKTTSEILYFMEAFLKKKIINYTTLNKIDNLLLTPNYRKKVDFHNAFLNKNYNKVILLSNSILNIYKNDTSVWYQLALSSYNVGKYELARTAFNNYLKIKGGNDLYTKILYANTFILENKKDVAINEYKKILANCNDFSHFEEELKNSFNQHNNKIGISMTIFENIIKRLKINA